MKSEIDNEEIANTGAAIRHRDRPDPTFRYSTPILTTKRYGKAKREEPFEPYKSGLCRSDIIEGPRQVYTGAPVLMLGDIAVCPDVFTQPSALKELFELHYGTSAGFGLNPKIRRQK